MRHSHTFVDLTGIRFGRLVVRFFVRRNSSGNALWSCECDCGGTSIVCGSRLRSGQVTKCKKHRSTRHKDIPCARSTEYRSFDHAKTRCNNHNESKKWRNYGGRGIEFRFESFRQFFSEIGPKPSPYYTLDRINNNGNYEPGNVRWATWKAQASNRRPRAKIEGNEVNY